jgi:hypothetical protein
MDVVAAAEVSAGECGSFPCDVFCDACSTAMADVAAAAVASLFVKMLAQPLSLVTLHEQTPH